MTARRPPVGPLIILGGVALAAVLALGILLGGRLGGRQAGVLTAAGRPTSVERDQLAPAFRLPTTAGEMIDLTDTQGHVVLINFWATWCPPCRDEMPVIEAAAQKYGDRGFRVLAVNVQEKSPQVVAFGQEMGLSFPLLLDASGDVSRAYRVQNLPRSFFLARDGRVMRIHPGELTAETVERYLQELL